MTDTSEVVPLEELAESDGEIIFDEHVVPHRAMIVRCPYCGGSGTIRGRFTALWGDSCWICAGWGSFDATKGLRLRGPVAPHPNR